MSRTELTVPVDVAAPPELVWRAVTDWPGQGEWMLGTRVEIEGSGDARDVGGRFRAFSGVGPLGFWDPMEVVEWVEPDRPSDSGVRRCVVRHRGRVVRGDGVFEVVELGPDRCRFLWGERLDLPLGVVGRLGWPLVRPAFRAGVLWSLRRMAGQCEQEFRRGV